MKVVVCHIDLFSLNQPIWLIDTETGAKEQKGEAYFAHSIPSMISYVADANETKNIHLYGLNDKVLSKFVEQIQCEAKKKYNLENNYYEIEVN